MSSEQALRAALSPALKNTATLLHDEMNFQELRQRRQLGFPTKTAAQQVTAE